MEDPVVGSRTDPGVQVMKVQQPVFLVSNCNKIIRPHSYRCIGLDMGRISPCHHLLQSSISGSDSDLQEAAH